MERKLYIKQYQKRDYVKEYKKKWMDKSRDRRRLLFIKKQIAPINQILKNVKPKVEPK